MSREIKVIEDFSGYKNNTVCYRTGSSEGDRFGFGENSSETPLRSLFNRIILGETFPREMIIGNLTLDAVVAASLFSNPNMVLQGECASFINSVEMIQSLGKIGLSHIPYDHKCLFFAVRDFLSDDGYSTKEQKQEALKRGVELISGFILKGQIPPSIERENYTEIESEGEFIAYKASSPLLDKIYSGGYLCGLWVNDKNESDTILFKKSWMVEALNLEAVAGELNKVDDLPENVQWRKEKQGEILTSPRVDDEIVTSLDYEDILNVLT